MDRKRQLHRKFVDYYSRSFGFARTSYFSRLTLCGLSACGSHNDEWLTCTESHWSTLVRTVSQEYDTSTVVSARAHEFQLGSIV